jgi:hypothetical protein
MPSKGNHIRLIGVIVSSVLILGFVLMLTLRPLVVHADSINLGVYSVTSKPYGLSYSNWTAKWWQWLTSIPQPDNPALDTTGKDCAKNQIGPIWFLAGTAGGSAERTCNIPIGKAILFPIVNSECSYSDTPTAKTVSELIACANQDPNRAINLQVTLDGRSLQQLEKYRVTSPLFNVVYGTGNALGLPAGPTQAVVNGFWMLLQPLPSGKHELHFASTTPAAEPGGTPFVIDTIYHLTVQ